MSAQPTRFNDSLVVRGKQAGRHRIGSPYTHLNNVGIVAVLERLYHGANLVDVASELDVSVTVLRQWLDAEKHWDKVNDATTLSAEGYLSKGQQLLATATDKFELDKAKAMIEHARWMAAKLDKAMYGTTEKAAAATTVSYVFNMGDGSGSVQVLSPAQPRAADDAKAPPMDIPTIDFDPTFGGEFAAPQLGRFIEPPIKQPSKRPDENAFAQMWSSTEDTL